MFIAHYLHLSILNFKNYLADENMEPQIMASELHNVRLKLEEKRRRIESEKRKMEQAMNKQRQKLGKEAFMQAVVKGVSTINLSKYIILLER